MSITTEKELAEALNNGQDTIEITGDLRNQVLKIKATGHTSWMVAAGAIGVAVAIVITSGGVGAPASAVVGAGAVSILGLSTATAAVAIAVAGGSISVLNKLRDYEIVKNGKNKLILKK